MSPHLMVTYGSSGQHTARCYVAARRAFFGHLAYLGLLPPGVTFEQVKLGLTKTMGRFTYRTPRIDQRLYLIVQYVDAIKLPRHRRTTVLKWSCYGTRRSYERCGAVGYAGQRPAA